MVMRFQRMLLNQTASRRQRGQQGTTGNTAYLSYNPTLKPKRSSFSLFVKPKRYSVLSYDAGLMIRFQLKRTNFYQYGSTPFGAPKREVPQETLDHRNKEEFSSARASSARAHNTVFGEWIPRGATPVRFPLVFDPRPAYKEDVRRASVLADKTNI